MEERRERGGGATVPFAGARPPMPGPARPVHGSGKTHGGSLQAHAEGPTRPTCGSLQTLVWVRRGLAEARAFWSFMWAYLLFLSYFNFLQLVICQDGIGGCKRHLLQMVQT